MSTSLWMPIWVLGVGQLSAIALHCFAWWLRHKALWVLSILGVLGAIGVGTLVFFLFALSGWGYDPSQPAQEQALYREFAITVASLLCGVCAIGLLHAWQLRTHWRARLRLWVAATLAVCGEVLLSVFVSYGLNRVLHQGSLEQGQFNTAFFVTLLVLMVLRPLILKFTRPLLTMVQRSVAPFTASAYWFREEGTIKVPPQNRIKP